MPPKKSRRAREMLVLDVIHQLRNYLREMGNPVPDAVLRHNMRESLKKSLAAYDQSEDPRNAK